MTILLLTVLACGGVDEEAMYDAVGPRYEARAWLSANGNPHPLASNRFESATAARAFVDTLYALGADTVFVTNLQGDGAWIAEEGGPYADALLVRLPEEHAARGALFAIGGREAAGEGFDPERDRGQRYLYFWWD